MREKLNRLSHSPWRFFLLCCAALLGFYLFFTRLFVKMDDGNFLGILNNEGFTLRAWLLERYQNISGRVIGEGLMMSFLSVPLIFWKIFAAAMFLYIVWFACRLSQGFGASGRRSFIFACCIPFLVTVSCLNPAAFWFAGSFTYLIPLASVFICITPLCFTLFNIKFRTLPHYVAAVVFAPLAASEEQAAASVCALCVILIAALIIRRRFNFRQLLPLLPACAATALLFASPGMRGRTAMEAAAAFERFADMGLAQKLLCGLSNYFAYAFLFSLAVLAFLLILLYRALLNAYGSSRAIRLVIRAHAAFALFVCVGLNLICIIVKRSLPDKSFEKMFTSGRFDPLCAAVIALCLILLLSIAALMTALAKKQPAAGFSVLVCFGAAVCCAAVLGFSSSIYASGQRVFFFSDVFTLLAALVLLSGDEDSRASKGVCNAAGVIAGVCFAVNCVTFALLEIPIMG